MQKIGPDINYIGIDPTHESIYKCHQKGHNAECLNVEEFKSKYPLRLFDYVVSFHCLEHISEPLIFLNDLKSLLNNNGNIFISTPYSPMTIEVDWFDILNHPPHHMGRWNKKSYEMVAEKANLNVEFYSPPPPNFVVSAISSFLFSVLNDVSSSLKINKQLLIKKRIITSFHFYKTFN